MKSKRKIDKAYVLPLFLVVLIMITALSNAVFAKYLRRFNYDRKVTVSAELVETLRLFEHEAVRNDMGEYALNNANEVSSNEYILMPGVDIPKDPHIEIKGKTSIPAYLYVEVVDKLNTTTVTYSLTGDWTLLSGITGPNGGKMYVYKEKLTGTPADITIPVLSDDTVYVSASLDRTQTNLNLDFYAYMLQINDDLLTADQIFDAVY